MQQLLARIRHQATQNPHQLAMRDELTAMDYGQLVEAMDSASGVLKGKRIGLLMDNSTAWACLDLAIIARAAVGVPLPNFFSEAQLRHVIADADLDEIMTDQPARVAALINDFGAEIKVAGHTVWAFHRTPQKSGLILPAGTVKVTYTSGTTGNPRGVCLSAEVLATVTQSLCHAVAAKASDRSLSLLPLSTLLENIAGLYAPLWSGALVQVPSLASCGFSGSSGLQIGGLFTALAWAQPTSIVLVPQLLKALVGGIHAGLSAPRSLRLIAVGGAPIAESLLHAATHLGLPVFQGYGLSEAGSVVCLNLPDDSRMGSVGKPLSHLRLQIAHDGEVVIRGPIHLGYLDAEHHAQSQGEWHTGDVGYVDDDGYLFLTGRKKTAFSTAFGRNVSPEWVEAALTGQPCIAQAALFGEGRPFNTAVLVPRPEVTPAELAQAVHTVNQHLPDYARIGRWVISSQAFTTANQRMNAAGCIQRQKIHADYQPMIDEFYESPQESPHVVL